jgi:hypothetical protein
MVEPSVPVVVVTRRKKWRTWLLRSLMIIAGLVVGLVVAEVIFYFRDHGAFPHLNLYVADPQFGVRLMPGSSEKIEFGGNPLTHVRINQAGYRGADLPAPSNDEILVVGDSQVFGLGVEEHETFSAVLGTIVHRGVMNGGVPTYGPAEYRAVIAEQLIARHPKTVVLTLNLANDLFEVERPNKDRHTVWDGWAVRKETAPSSTTWFPGRDFLYRRSHLFFALRKWRHTSDAANERGVASEGTWMDLVANGKQLDQEKKVSAQTRDAWLRDVTSTMQEIDRVDLDINQRATSVFGPADIVDSPLLEGSRPVQRTASQLAAAAAVRAKLRKFEQWQKDHESPEGQRAVRQELAAWAEGKSGADAKATKEMLALQTSAEQKLSTLYGQSLSSMVAPPFADHLRDVQKLVESAGARLIVLVLPLDVQVSSEEWKKYGKESIDMEPSNVLTQEIVEFCRSIGVSAVDATPVLARSEPGAFLDKDIHMTPKGHAAVAGAIANTISEPAPARASTALTIARTSIPTPAMYDHAAALQVKGLEQRCETKQVREWLRVWCYGRGVEFVNAESISKDDEVLILSTPGQVSMVVPVVRGHRHAIAITTGPITTVLHIDWTDGPAATIALDVPTPTTGKIVVVGRESFRSSTEMAICDCWSTVSGFRNFSLAQRLHCPQAYGAPNPACVKRYVEAEHVPRCEQLIQCILNDPASPP